MTITNELITQHGLTADEYQRIVEALRREPTLTELTRGPDFSGAG